MRRPDKIFGHQTLHTPIASYVGLIGIVLGAYWLITGAASMWWLLPMSICTYLQLCGVTVGLHRLFCHSAFRTSKFWHVILAYLGTLAVYGSTVQWAGMHASHHKYSDTDKDPHYTGLRYLLWKKNRETVFQKKVVIRLYRQPLHRFLHNYYVLPIAFTIAALWLISPFALVFCYLIPLGWLHFTNSIHQVFAHDQNGPKDQKWLEYVLFTAGEWLHKWHHDNPRDPRFGKSDLGFAFIRIIRK